MTWISAERFRAIVSGRESSLAARSARLLLAIGEGPYSLAVGCRNRAYDRGQRKIERVGVPVISVGNLTLGGTGKTPLVAWIARWFRQHDVRVSIVSRGYGRAQGAATNDEAQELERRLPDVPHIQNADRVAGAQVAIDELATQVILLDDGFQHRRLARDLDLVLIDATEPFGYDHVFPRGLLREPLAGLRRAHGIILTRAHLVDSARRDAIRRIVQQVAPTVPWMEVGHRIDSLRSASDIVLAPDSLQGKSVVAFCGIGNPSAFRRTLDELGCRVIGLREFPDHHAFNAATVSELTSWVRHHADIDAVICTHKDLVKLQVDRLGDKPLYAATLELNWLQGSEIIEGMLERIAAQIPADE